MIFKFLCVFWYFHSLVNCERSERRIENLSKPCDCQTVIEHVYLLIYIHIFPTYQSCFLFPLAVESLIYWRDVKKSGIVFGAGLVTLVAISCFSVISVFAYLSLLALFGTVAFRIYKSVTQAVQKTNDGHPFK